MINQCPLEVIKRGRRGLRIAGTSELWDFGRVRLAVLFEFAVTPPKVLSQAKKLSLESVLFHFTVSPNDKPLFDKSDMCYETTTTSLYICSEEYVLYRREG